MPRHEPPPFHSFLRRYAAELDGAPDTPTPTANDLLETILQRYPPSELESLIQNMENALESGSETVSRALFRDGHFFHVWKSPTAASDYLRYIESTAKKVRADKSER